MIFKNLREDIETALRRDPAARSRIEVLLCYPGLHALLMHRLAHRWWRRGWFLAGRLLSHWARLLTGIEIHPGARLGRRVFIDHGMGVVIGETAEIGDDVTLYQGVTLGGTALAKGKRHPTIGNGVIIGSGAQILGSFRVGDGARIGANAVVLAAVADGATMVGIPARRVGGAAATAAHPAEDSFLPYGTPRGEDPVSRTLAGLAEEVAALHRRLAELEGRRERRVLVDLDGAGDLDGAAGGPAPRGPAADRLRAWEDGRCD